MPRCDGLGPNKHNNSSVSRNRQGDLLRRVMPVLSFVPVKTFDRIVDVS